MSTVLTMKSKKDFVYLLTATLPTQRIKDFMNVGINTHFKDIIVEILIRKYFLSL